MEIIAWKKEKKHQIKEPEKKYDYNNNGLIKNQRKEQIFNITMAMFISKYEYNKLIRFNIPYYW